MSKNINGNRALWLYIFVVCGVAIGIAIMSLIWGGDAEPQQFEPIPQIDSDFADPDNPTAEK